MDYIDEQYRRMMAAMGRFPANDAFDQVLKTGKPAPPGTNLVGNSVPNSPNAVLNPLGAEMPGPVLGSELNPYKEPVTVIEGMSAATGPILPTYEDPSRQVPYIENYRTNINPALRTQIADTEALIDKQKQVEEERALSKSALLNVIKAASESPEPFKSKYDYDERIKKLSEMSDIGQTEIQIPKRDFLSEMILNLGPALGAKFMGEAGALAAPTAMKNARDIYETQRKEEIEALKQGAALKTKLADEISKRMIGLRQLKEGEYGIYEKENKFKFDQLNKLADRLEKVHEGNRAEIKDIETKAQALGIDTTKNVMSGAKEMAGMEARREELLTKEAGLKQRAKIGAVKAAKKGEDLSLDKRKMVEKYAGEIARITGINSQVEELKKQIGDKSISEQDRRATAQEQLKLLNSTLGSDAVGAEETRRMAAFLDPMPNWIKKTPGADLDGFYRQLDRVNQRLSGTISAQQKEIDKIYGRPIKEEKKPSIETPPKDFSKAPKGMSFEEFRKWKRGK